MFCSCLSASHVNFLSASLRQFRLQGERNSAAFRKGNSCGDRISSSLGASELFCFSSSLNRQLCYTIFGNLCVLLLASGVSAMLPCR